MSLRLWQVLLSALLWASSASMVHAGNNVWTSNGPEGGIVSALAVDPVTPTTLYAGTGGGGVLAITFTVAVNRDFNGDVRSDILWRHTAGTLYLWFMNGTNVSGQG